jgi:DNA-binding HxlR family transcriptional regulator
VGSADNGGVSNYTEYCPITAGVDVLGDRWTPLVIRELTLGSTGFNEIHRGVPRMSRTILAQRLRQLEKQGVVTRSVGASGRSGSYRLTPAGQALSPVVWALGHWAAEWVFGGPKVDERDALGVLWRLHQFAIPEKLPAERTVVHMVLTGPGGAEGWLGIDGREVSVCREDPGYDVDLVVEGDTGQVQQWVVGRVGFTHLVRSGEVRVIGPSRLVRAFPFWFKTDSFATSMRRGVRRQTREAG